jgi:uroporphyrinogen III methyltransferase/synthase
MPLSTQVYLVGAGPGDPDLFTYKMGQVLSRADVVLYDYLAHPNFRQYCAPHATLLNVGKKKGAHSAQQSSINALMMKYVSAGKMVVRLKGGDPLLFGRGGEEMVFLSENKIRYEVVPGVSASLAVPAYAGIPLTKRGDARSVAIVTGTTHTGGVVAATDIPHADTIVVLMAITHLELLVTTLIDHPRFSADTPAMVVQEGTMAAQRKVTATLRTISQTVTAAGIKHPAILIVGNVVNYSQALSWREALPLFGYRVWLCRAAHQQREMTQFLSQYGAEVMYCPLIQIDTSLESDLSISSDRFKSITTLILTSQNAVKGFFSACQFHGVDIRELHGIHVIVVGQKTAQVLRSYGIIADQVASTQCAQGILEIMPTNLSGTQIYIPHSKQSDPGLIRGLKQRGAGVIAACIYDTKLVNPPEAMRLRDHDRVILLSQTQVRSFLAHLYSGQQVRCIVPSSALADQIQSHPTFGGQVMVAPSTGLMDIYRTLT